MARVNQVSVRFDNKELKAIEHAASKSRRKVADFLRVVALDEVEKVLNAEKNDA
jgi:uncharacterized protein (DUF1778 family)